MSASIWAPGSNLVTVDAESTNLSQVFTATDSQIIFNLTLFSYVVGTGSIAVYRGGQRLVKGTDWEETTSSSISLIGFTVSAGETIEVVAVLGAASAASVVAQAAAAEAVAAAASVSSSILPSQTGQAGQFLKTNGTTTDWEVVDALPSQTGNSGKFLTTDGSAASWTPIAGVTLNGIETLTNKTLTTPTIDTNFNFSGASGVIKVGGVDKVVIGTSGIEAGSFKAGSIRPVDTQVGALPSMVRLNTSPGNGSTNAVIRRMTTVVLNQGTDITYADSATLGATITINTTGEYAISYTDHFAGAVYFGLSLNATGADLTTSILSIAIAKVLALINVGANTPATVNWTGFLTAGDIIRMHNNGITSTGANNLFTIARVA